MVNTAARGGVYTALRSAVGGRGTYAFLSVFFPLFFSCSPPRFFASGRGPLLPGPELRKDRKSTRLTSREVLVLHPPPFLCTAPWGEVAAASLATAPEGAEPH